MKMSNKLEIQNKLEMPIVARRPRRSARQSLSFFGMLSVAALLSSAVLCAAIKLSVGRGSSVPLPVPISMFVIALVVVTGIRWTPLVGALAMIGYLIAFYFQPFVAYHLSQPKIYYPRFVMILLLIVILILGVGASIGAFVQNYRRSERSTPRWFSYVLTLMVGIVVGAILIGAISSGTAASAVSTTTYTNGVPTVHMNIDSFLQSSVSISKGSKLLLVDDGSYHHVLSNGSWAGGQPQPESPAGAPTINSLSISNTSIAIGPFVTAGTYHVYCSIHSGMMLTVIVQ